eukprot:4286945-Lingulodinium_polyedra.AAC.1
MHSVLAENAKHPEFWSLCQDSEISQFDPNVEGRLVEIVVGKIMLVTQECNCDDAMASLDALCKAYWPVADSKKVTSQKLHDDMLRLAPLVSPGQ